MTSLSEDSRIRLAGQSVWSQLGDEIVILDLESSAYLGLESVGATIWELLSEPRRVDEIECHLLETFDADPAELSRDLREFLGHLVERGLAVLDEEAS